MKRHSLRQRLRLLLILLPMCLAVTGVVVMLAFEAAQQAANQKRLKASVYALMTVVEPVNGELIFPSALPEPEFNDPLGDWLAIARSPEGEVLWSAPFGRPLPLPDPTVLPPVPKNEIHEYFPASTLKWPKAYHGPSYNLLRARVSYEVFAASAKGKKPKRQLIPVMLEIWQDNRLLEAPRREFLTVLGIGMLAMGVLLSLALWATIRWTLRPLSGVVSELRLMEIGDQARFSDNYPVEIQQLADAINTLLDIERNRREQYRQRLGDLAHSLKTPLALLKGDLERIQDPEQQEWMRQIGIMDDLVAYHLKRAVSGAGVWHSPEPLNPLLGRLVYTLSKVHASHPSDLQMDVPMGLQVNVEQTDSMEIFGNLLDNACKYGRGQVRVRVNESAVPKAGYVSISVEDNGPGIPDASRQWVLGRGRRLDQQAPGQGIGLSVVYDLVRAYGGDVELGDSPLGGLAVTVNLPGSIRNLDSA